MAKTETIPFRNFVAGASHAPTIPSKALPLAIGTSATLPLAFASNPVMSLAAEEGTKETIRHAFDPLIEMITQISFPVAAVMITGGALMIMIGMKDKGYTVLFQAAIGFILVQMSPLLLDLLFSVGTSIS